MAISGIGGPQGPQEPQGPKGTGKTEKDNSAEINQKIQQYFSQAANAETKDNEINTPKESNIFNNAINTLRNQFPGAADFIDKAAAKLTGGNKAEQTQPTGTHQDVQGATNETNIDNKTQIDDNGNVTNFGENPDGEQVTVGDNNISVTDADGNSVGGTRILANGMQVLVQPDGQEGVYDPKKGQFLPEDEAKKILAEMG